MAILSYFARFTRTARMPAAEILGWKGANIRDLLCTTPKVLKLHESQFWNILKILGEERTRGGPLSRGGTLAQPIYGSGGAVLPGKHRFGRGKSSTSSSPSILSSRGGQSPSTYSLAPSPLKTLVHLLYPIFVPKPQIGTCGLLVVLITPCS